MRDTNDASPTHYPWGRRAAIYRKRPLEALLWAANDIYEALLCAQELAAAGYRHKASFYADELHTVEAELSRRQRTEQP